MKIRAVVLLSGGADSATCLALARAQGREVFALSFDYGQRHRIELRYARALARRFGCREHRVARVDLPGRSTSALTSKAIEVPRGGVRKGRIPVTYVPARNTLFLAHARSWAKRVARPRDLDRRQRRRLLRLSTTAVPLSFRLREDGQPRNSCGRLGAAFRNRGAAPRAFEARDFGSAVPSVWTSDGPFLATTRHRGERPAVAATPAGFELEPKKLSGRSVPGLHGKPLR
jgi:hypothetical protein